MTITIGANNPTNRHCPKCGHLMIFTEKDAIYKCLNCGHAEGHVLKAFPPLRRGELLAFLKLQRPDVSPESWEKVDVLVVLEWLLPAYAQHLYLQERGTPP